jgi:hypothetical protein
VTDGREQQIRTVHAAFIHAVVRAVANADARIELEPLLKTAQEQGWVEMVRAVRAVLNGRRDTGLLNGLDEEDHAIVSAVLEGIRNPASLPDPNAKPEGRHAAPGLAGLVSATRRGDARALAALGDMAKHMLALGGDMALLSARLRDLLNGERDAEKLARGMGPAARGLMTAIVEELRRGEAH